VTCDRWPRFNYLLPAGFIVEHVNAHRALREKGGDMKRMIVGFCIFIVVLMPAFARTAGEAQGLSVCGLTEANAPTVRSIHLGMSVGELAALFPGSAKRKEVRDALERAKAATGNEPLTITFDPSMDGGGERFAGVATVSAITVKGRVVAFSVFYVGTAWPTIDEWVTKLAETYSLPAASHWSAGLSESPDKILACGGIEVEAAIQGGGSSVSVRNREALRKPGEHGNAGDERKRREFKP
jgi:hypothetical protein